MEGEVEVDDQADGGSARTEIGALRGIEEIPAGAVGLVVVRGIAERQEQAPGVARHPVDAEAAFALREGDVDSADPGELFLAAGAHRERQCEAAELRPGGLALALDDRLEPQAGVVREMRGAKAGSGGDGDRRLRVGLEERLARGPPRLPGALGIGRRLRSDGRIEVGDAPSPVGEVETVEMLDGDQALRRVSPRVITKSPTTMSPSGQTSPHGMAGMS